MLSLTIVSLLWAVSFGLIKHQLAGIDVGFVSLIRLSFSTALFLPFLRMRGIRVADLLRFMTLGAVQYGFMYLAYIESFRYLAAYQVALLTIFTPLCVTLTNDILQRRWHGRHWLSAGLAVAGAAVIIYRETGTPTLIGVFLVQISNLCFAVGQVFYVRLMTHHPDQSDRSVFSLLYAGGTLISALFWLGHGMPLPEINTAQWITLTYLGIIASGVAFFLWNVGARRVSSGILAVMNNLKIPLGVLAALLFFGESTRLDRLLIGGFIFVLALFMNRD